MTPFGTLTKLLITVALLAGLSMVAHGREVKHPSLLVDSEQIEEIKKNIEAYPWAKKLWIKVRDYADKSTETGRLADRIALREVGLAYAITKDEKYKKPIRKFLLAEPLGRPNTFSWQWGPRPISAVYLYDLAYDLFSAEEHKQIEAHFRVKAMREIEIRKTKQPTPNMSAHAHMSVGLIGFCIGDQELIDWALDNDRVKSYGGLRKALEDDSTGGRMVDGGLFWRESNWNYGCASLGYWMTLAEAATHNGIDLYKWKTADGNGLKEFIDGYLRLAFPLEPTGVNAGTVRVATFGHGGHGGPFGDGFLANPPGINAPDRLTWRRFPSMAALLEVAYRRYKDPAYAWLISLNPNRDDYWYAIGFAALTHGVQLPEKIVPPKAQSGVYPQMGLAMLRSQEGTKYWGSEGLTVFHKMGHPVPHGQADYYEMVLHAYGRVIYPDLITASGSYEKHPYLWANRSCGHNTIAIDGMDLDPGPSPHRNYTVRHAFTPEVKFLITRAKSPTKKGDDVQLSRTFFLTKEYLGDFFAVQGEQAHTYDWYLHGFGRLRVSCDEDFKGCDKLRGPWPVRLINEEKMRTPSPDVAWWAEWIQQYAGVKRGSGRATDQWFDQRVGVRLRMLGEAGTTVFRGDGPYTAPMPKGADPRVSEGALPLVAARRECKGTTFAAVHEPFRAGKQEPRIRAIYKLAGDEAATGVDVEASGFRDILVVAQGDTNKSVTLTNERDGHEQVAFSNYGYVRISGSKIVGRGGLQSFVLSAPEVPGKGAVMLNGRQVAYTVTGGYVVYGKKPTGRPAIPRLLSFSCDTEVVRGQSIKVTAELLVRERVNVGIAGPPASWSISEPAKALEPGRKSVSFMIAVPKNAEPGDVVTLFAYYTGDDGKRHRMVGGQELIVVPELEFREIRGVRLDDGGSGSVSVTVRNRMPGRHNLGLVFIDRPVGIRLEGERVEVTDLGEDEERVIKIDVRAVPDQAAGKYHKLVTAFQYSDAMKTRRRSKAFEFPVTVGMVVVRETVHTQKRHGASRVTQESLGYRIVTPRYEARMTEEGDLTSLIGSQDFGPLPPATEVVPNKTMFGTWAVYSDYLLRPTRSGNEAVIQYETQEMIWEDGFRCDFRKWPEYTRRRCRAHWLYLKQAGIGVAWLPQDAAPSKVIASKEYGAPTVYLEISGKHGDDQPKEVAIVFGKEKEVISRLTTLVDEAVSEKMKWIKFFSGPNLLKDGGFEGQLAANWLSRDAELNLDKKFVKNGKKSILLTKGGSTIEQTGIKLKPGKKAFVRFKFMAARKGKINFEVQDAHGEGVFDWEEVVVTFKGGDDKFQPINFQGPHDWNRQDKRGVTITFRNAVSQWAEVGIQFRSTKVAHPVRIWMRNGGSADDQRLWIDEIFVGQEE